MTQVHLELASEARWDPLGSQVGVVRLESGVGEGPGPRVSDAKGSRCLHSICGDRSHLSRQSAQAMGCFL